MRTSPTFRLTLLGLVTLPAVVAATGPGCQHADPLPAWKHEDVETLPVQPAWQQFVDENYRGTVIAHLGGSRGVQFELPPHVTATRNKSRNAIELLAVGEADVPNAAGKVFRHPYTIVWRQSGSGWRPYEVRVEPGVEHNPPPTVKPGVGPATTRSVG